jgi:hypothetical protein
MSDFGGPCRRSMFGAYDMSSDGNGKMFDFRGGNERSVTAFAPASGTSAFDWRGAGNEAFVASHMCDSTDRVGAACHWLPSIGQTH